MSRIDGDLVVVDPDGTCLLFPRSAESSLPQEAGLYGGNTLEEVLASPTDLLAASLTGVAAGPRTDPDPSVVAGTLVPITELAVHTFIGTPESIDKVGFEYGGRTPNFDPAVYDSRMFGVRAQRRVLDGLVGGWLPAPRFVYPVDAADGSSPAASAPARPWMDLATDDPHPSPQLSVADTASTEWFEVIAFAPFRILQGNRAVQPVWYRVTHVQDGRLVSVRYIDTFPPIPPAQENGNARDFVADLLAFAAEWRTRMAGASIRVPDVRLANLARHSLVKSMMTRFGDDPKYGVLDRLYGGAEHDGFQDTFTTDLAAAVEWGHSERARSILTNYLSRFVRDDGSLLYRGPGTGQYGRMLTAVAQYALSTGDFETVSEHRIRIDAIARLLLDRRADSLELPEGDPGRGLIAGWCEADSCLETDPSRYHLPYLSNSAEAVRGWSELARMWRAAATFAVEDAEGSRLRSWAAELDSAAEALRADLLTVVTNSTRWDQNPPWLPVIAGVDVPYDVAVSADAVDPQFRAYRANMELVYSGILPLADAEHVIDYRAARHDVICGVPCAYNYDTAGGGEPRHGELAVFLSYGHGWGLLRADRIEDFLLELYALAFHGNTRGSWTAPETRRIHPGLSPAPYAVPAQLAVPMLLRWALVWEDPETETIWLGRGVPRDWLLQGGFSADAVPTTYGPVSVRVTVEDSATETSRMRLRYEIEAPTVPDSVALALRLRLPGSAADVRIDGQGSVEVDDASGAATIRFEGPGRFAGIIVVDSAE
ncbi:hypothetical protein [Leifsonia poae]|uniref:hypothetical protein n=1 Tax=Leifsonia poae TaxID=110933 RepID=UPI003D66CEC7